MADNQGKAPRLLAQPISELIYAADVFGSDFDKRGRLQHLHETSDNVHALWINSARLATLLRDLKRQTKDKTTRQRISVHLDFVRDLERDFETIAGTIKTALDKYEGVIHE